MRQYLFGVAAAMAVAVSSAPAMAYCGSCAPAVRYGYGHRVYAPRHSYRYGYRHHVAPRYSVAPHQYGPRPRVLRRYY